MAEDDTTTVDAAAEDADFGAGFAGTEGKTANGKTATEKPGSAATPRAEAEPSREKRVPDATPDYVQITAKDWADVRAAAGRTASYDSQFSKAFGTLGQIQKILNDQKTQTPAQTAAAVRRIEIPKEAFAAMRRDFPELADQVQTALEAALSGLPAGASDADPEKIESMLAAHTSKREIAALEDAYPEWRKIVGAVDIKVEKPDPDNPFRKWLATKDQAYQARITGSESAMVIGRAIRLFQTETKAAPAKPAPRNDARAERIRAAVQPRGDNAGAAPDRSDDDEFDAGFNSR